MRCRALDYCSFIGTVPGSLAQLSNLTTFNVRGNQLTAWDPRVCPWPAIPAFMYCDGSFACVPSCLSSRCLTPACNDTGGGASSGTPPPPPHFAAALAVAATPRSSGSGGQAAAIGGGIGGGIGGAFLLAAAAALWVRRATKHDMQEAGSGSRRPGDEKDTNTVVDVTELGLTPAKSSPSGRGASPASASSSSHTTNPATVFISFRFEEARAEAEALQARYHDLCSVFSELPHEGRKMLRRRLIVFLGYRRPQAALADIGVRSFACAYGNDALMPGDHWNDVIAEAMDKCFVFVALATRTYGCVGTSTVDTKKVRLCVFAAAVGRGHRQSTSAQRTAQVQADPRSAVRRLAGADLRAGGEAEHLSRKDGGWRVRGGLHTNESSAPPARLMAPRAAAAGARPWGDCCPGPIRKSGVRRRTRSCRTARRAAGDAAAARAAAVIRKITASTGAGTLLCARQSISRKSLAAVTVHEKGPDLFPLQSHPFCLSLFAISWAPLSAVRRRSSVSRAPSQQHLTACCVRLRA